ncbi:hypothetical protein [Flavobacterium sp. JP2137]|uniref:hypothetical protein n=1 Tax=Flavobacterium sp. JP2137 TaxID=3414510 RepID=UPI003D2FE826
MKTVIHYFKQWALIRYLRLGIGLVFLFEMIDSGLWALGFVVAFFFFQAFFMSCSADSCGIRLPKKKK